MFNFLALLDIRIFGRLYLTRLLIGLALFLQPGYFYLALLFTEQAELLVCSGNARVVGK